MLQQPPIFHNGTTRRFPRSLEEAFGGDGYAITHYRNRWSGVNRAVVFVLWVLVLAWGATLWT
jgi:hypothetical protein